MEAYSSGGEDVVIKARKPYTITKQRERWTEEEHNRFLEALKLHGRAWQRIEEHIGTKTAVQIRSHAQKFFSKLEKEAVAKGASVGQSLDIEIPPPRPKRKPSNPYPRKTGASSSNNGAKDGKLPIADSSLPCKQQSILEVQNGDEKLAGAAETHDDNCSGVFSVSSISSEPFRSLIPSFKELVSHGESKNMCTAKELESRSKLNKTDDVKDSLTSTSSILECSASQKELLMPQISAENFGNLQYDMQSMNNFPRHVPVHVIDGNPVIFEQPADHLNGRNSVNSFLGFPPFVQTHQDLVDLRSILPVPSTFSSLILSILLQNPAAAFWPYGNAGNSADCPTCTHGSSHGRQMLSSPNMAAIASATVAAATAWWAAQGLLPLCPPMSVNPISSLEERQNQETKDPSKEAPLVQENLEDLQNPAPKCEEAAASVLDGSKANCMKQANRSSCGSNTTSSSDFEMDAIDNLEQKKEETKEPDSNQILPSDSGCRRGRMSISSGDSRKEVSEEGRLAFEALFSMEVLPQSFLPAQKAQTKDETGEEKDEGADDRTPDLNVTDKNPPAKNENGGEESAVAFGVGSGKMKGWRTGFKPYKRCSAEAGGVRMVTGGSQGEDNCSKRIRLEGE